MNLKKWIKRTKYVNQMFLFTKEALHQTIQTLQNMIQQLILNQYSSRIQQLILNQLQ